MLGYICSRMPWVFQKARLHWFVLYRWGALNLSKLERVVAIPFGEASDDFQSRVNDLLVV